MGTAWRRKAPIFLLAYFVGTILCSSTRASIPVHRTLTHSHNDYEQEFPLTSALGFHFDSVEADLWLEGDEILISHRGLFFKGSLEDLYLKPIHEIIQQNKGSVYGDGKQFYLWLDLKSSSPDILPKLHQLLAKYSKTITTFDKEGSSQGPLVVILTGNDELKKKYVTTYPLRYATRDSTDISNSDPPADGYWLWYALNWNEFLESFDPQRLNEIIQLAHSKGRKLRFWNMPAEVSLWSAAIQANIDMIGTDNLSGLADFFNKLYSVSSYSSR